MNEYFVLAFIVTPLTLLAMGWAAVFLHEWDMRRQKNRAPAE